MIWLDFSYSSFKLKKIAELKIYYIFFFIIIIQVSSLAKLIITTKFS